MLPDIVCFSHLRWNFVYQRPQHIMTRFSANQRVFYIEEPYITDDQGSEYQIFQQTSNLYVIRPQLPPGLSASKHTARMRRIVNAAFLSQQIKDYILWYYSPMMLAFSDHLTPVLKIYDCMDELSAFLFAPRDLADNERLLMKSADLVFAGGHSLYLAKRSMHDNIHLFPSSIDRQHFMSAREFSADPIDQQNISRPRFGFYGVIDERFNIEVLTAVADERPLWQFILVGPVVKIDPAILPQRRNIHYLGPKQYSELPGYLGGWTAALIPFYLDASTRFISPTKTPEYLAGGKPVISSSIKDVVDMYGKSGLVHIADTAEEFIQTAENILTNGQPAGWLGDVDKLLSKMSWDTTVKEMRALISAGISRKISVEKDKSKSYV